MNTFFCEIRRTWSLSPFYPWRGYNTAPMTDIRPLIGQNVSARKNTNMADVTPPNTVHTNLSCTRELFNSTMTYERNFSVLHSTRAFGT